MKRLLRTIGVIALLATFGSVHAQARLLSGFLAQCTAVAAGSCTEQTATGYARQPMVFSNVANGVSASAVPFTFAPGITGTIAGRALYDAATGGNLLIVMPLASSLTLPSIGDRADVGALKLNIPAAAGQPEEAFNASYATGATLGTTGEGSTVTTGASVTFQHGLGTVNLGSADPNTRQVTQTTGFTYAVPSGVSSLNIKGAGTLAAGTVTLPVPLADGSIFRLACSITITALTLSPSAPATIIGTAPSTCGANASHELQYFAGDTTWHVLF